MGEPAWSSRASCWTSVLDELNAQLAAHGLMFGPKPATHDHCTLGGMSGNNSCGATAQAYGKTVDNLVRLEVLTHDGERFWAGPTSDEEYAAIVAAGGLPIALPHDASLAADYLDRVDALVDSLLATVPTFHDFLPAGPRMR